MTRAAELIDRVVEQPPGDQLSAALAGLPLERVPNERIVEVLQARSRQSAHEQAQLWATLVEISHRVALDDLPPGSDPAAVVRTPASMEWAGHEIAAGLAWTPTAAEFELATATAVCERLPLVFTALNAGAIDRAKALVFADYLDPNHGEITDDQCRRLCERFVPLASGLTTRQLRERLLRALRTLDTDLRRRYRRAVAARSVALYLDPHTGTATLAASGLAPDEAAAAAARLDRLADAAKRAGHPGTRPQISADLHIGMLNGRFYGMTEDEILQQLLTEPHPDDQPEPPAGPGPGPGPTGPDYPGPTTTASAEAPEPQGTAEERTEPASGRGTDRWAEEPVGTREGIEIRLGLGTAAGRDDRPGDVPGLGPVDAWVARAAVAAQHRGGEWKFALVDEDGYLLLAGPLRRRPRTPDRDAGRARGGMVELHLGLDELDRHLADPHMRKWHGVLEEIAAAWANRDELRARRGANPHARFARGALADHIRIRDRNCCGPGCVRSARRSDLDHSYDHQFGGLTLESNLGPCCRRHHPDKDRGWRLTQPEPGLFRWRSPLGRVYFTKGQPVRPDLPDPDDQAAGQTDEANLGTPFDQQLRRSDRPIMEPSATTTPRPPPSRPEPPAENIEPPF